MRRFVNLAFLSFAATLAVAQSVPPQFQNLLTTSTDYTCAGAVPCATWPMPPMPAPGGSYSDPTWGTTSYRLAVPPGNPHGNNVPTYSRVQAWSSDNKHMFMSEPFGAGALDIYDATTTPPTPINRITTTDGTYVNSINGDAYWSNTIPTRIYYVPADQEAHSLELRWVDVSDCTAANCVLTSHLVHTFSCLSDSYMPKGAGIAGNQIETGSGGQGGMFDSTDTFFSFSCDFVQGEGNDRYAIDFIRYNRVTDTVTTQEKWYSVCTGGVPSGCGVWNNGNDPYGQGDDMFRMNQHPDANYITVIWMCNGAAAPSIGCGTSGFGPSYNFLGPISIGDNHQDTGFDINGIPVVVRVGGDSPWAFEVTDLTKLSPTAYTSKWYELPCQFAKVYTGTYPCSGTSLIAKWYTPHISLTGTWGSTPGYGLMSVMSLAGQYGSYSTDLPARTTLGTAVTTVGVNTVTPGSMANIGVGTVQLVDAGVAPYPDTATAESVTVTSTTATTFTATFKKTHPATATVVNLSVGDTGPFAMELVALKFDSTQPTGSALSFYRIGRAMSIRDADYNAEPHAAVNRDFTQIIWGSNWNTDGGQDNGYWMALTPNSGSLPAAGVTLTAAPNPAILDEQVTLTATVAQTGKAVPTGTVNFLNGAETLGTAPLDSSGIATLGDSTLPAGSYSLVASYSGDANYPAESSSAVFLEVQSATTTSLVASPNPVKAGQALALTATVTASGAQTLTGSINFMNGAALLGSGVPNASGVATLSTAALPAGNYSFSAQYLGDANSLTSTSPAVSVTVTGAPAQTTTTTLTAGPNPMAVGQSLALTATVTGSSGTVPAGTVNFLNGAALLGTGALNASGVASLSTANLTAGSYSLTAQFVGNATALTSTSQAVSVTVQPAGVVSTASTLAVNPNPVSEGQTMSLTATVKGTNNNTPAGLLNFLIDNKVVQVVTLDSSGIGTLSIPAPAAGPHILLARYRGNGSLAASTSPSVSLTVMAGATQSTTTSLVVGPNPVTAGQALTMTATVKGSGAALPAGTVNFMNGATLLGAGALNASGAVSISTVSLAAGTYNLTAQYVGNASSAASTSPAIPVTVTAAGTGSTITTLVVTPNPVTAGQTLSLTATVTGSNNTTPAGLLNFLVDNTVVQVVTLNSSGVGTLSIPAPAAGTHVLLARYRGNGSSAASTSASVSLTVSAGAIQSTNTTLVVTPNPVTAGQTLSLTATVKGSTNKTPAGLLNFMINDSVLQVVTLNSSGVGTLSIPAPAAGAYEVWVRYVGDGSSAASFSHGVTLTVKAAAQATKTTLVASPNPVTAGEALTLIATVKGGGAAIPTGSVNFMDGATLLGTGALNASGVATLSTLFLPAGTNNLTAQYMGDGSSLTSISPAVQITVAGKAVPTRTSLAASSNSVTAGEALLLTATVQSTGSAKPAGSVNFLNGKTVLGTANLNASGVATLSVNSLTVGKCSISAQYEGNKGFLTSTSPAISATVTAQVTTASLVASSANEAPSQDLTLTATVKGTGAIVPAGTVSFLKGATVLGTAVLNASGAATFSISTLAPGTYSLMAEYAGDASSLASKSASLSVTVTAKGQPTATSLAASPSSLIVGEAFALTATVQATGATIPGGSVNFVSGKVVLGTAVLNAKGVATLSTSSLAVGKYSLSAEYAGNKDFLTSASSAVSVTVTAQGTTTSLAASPRSIVAGQALALNATVKGSGPLSPAGTVNFTNGAVLVGTASLNAAGVATLSTSSLAAGSYSLTAEYAGNAGSLASKSAGVTVTVTPKVQPTTASLAASPSAVNAGQALALTATVQATGPGRPVGVVSFMNGATVLGTANLNSSGVATFSTSTLVAGIYSLTAQYPGDAGFLTSTSPGIDVTVNQPASSGPGAPPPAIFYTDITSGPNSGGEGNNGSYLTIYGSRFGATQGTSKVTINGETVAAYLLWSDTKIGVQVGPVSSGAIVVDVDGVRSNANLTFTVRSGNIYFIGSEADNTAPPADCTTLLAGNSFSHPWGLTNYASRTEADYSYSTMRTPYTYYRCISQGDTLVFLNGVSYPYFDGRGMHASLTPDKAGDSATSFVTFMARPGASVELGGTGWAMAPIIDLTAGHNVFSGLTLTGSGVNGGAYFNHGAGITNDRVVGNEITCPDCSGSAAAVMASNGFIMYGNTVSDVSTLDPGGSNKGYNAIDVSGNNVEIGWNKITNTLANNGIELNAAHSSGLFNQSYHDNDISQVNGDGIDLAAIDPSSGYIKVYNNVIHQVGVRSAVDGGSGDPHACIGVKGDGTGKGAGTADIYNNTMYDCSAYLEVNPTSNASCAILVLNNQLNVTTNLVNNIAYQPTYAGTHLENVYICGAGSVGTVSGSNNLWYSDSAPGSVAPANSMGTIANPKVISDIDYRLLPTSPAIGAGVSFEGLTTDFDGITRPKIPAIGAFE